MKFLKRALEWVLWGYRKHARVFRHDGKIYMLDNSCDELIYWSGTYKDYVKSWVKNYFKFDLAIFFNLIAAVAGAVIVFGSGLPILLSLLATLLVFGTLNLSLIKLGSLMEDAAISFMAFSEQPEIIDSYAGKANFELIEIVPSLTLEQIVEMIDNASELVTVEEMIDQAESFLKKDSQSLLYGEIVEKLNNLRAQEKELERSQRLDGFGAVYDSEALGILQQMEEHLSKTAKSEFSPKIVEDDSRLVAAVEAADCNKSLSFDGSDLFEVVELSGTVEYKVV